MEKNSNSLENLQTAFLEKKLQTCEVPKSFMKMMTNLGPFCAIRIVIGRLRWRVMCRILYNIDLLRTCQINYNRLKASKVTLWIIRKSIQSYRFSTLIWKIENRYRNGFTLNPVKNRSSKDFDEMSNKYNSIFNAF